jgi:alginate production protein
MRKKLIRGVLLLALAGNEGSATPRTRPIRDLQEGLWVEVAGRVEKSQPTATEIGEKAPGPAPREDRLEITARIEALHEDGQIRLLGCPVFVSGSTRFEDGRGREVPAFALRKGDWVKVKLQKRRGRLLVRELRRIDERERFKVEGAVTHIRPDETSIEVGGVRLWISPRTEVELLGSEKGGERTDPLAALLGDEQKSVPFTLRLHERLLLGSQLTLEGSMEESRNLKRDPTRDKQALASEMKLDLLWLLDRKGSLALFEGTFGLKEDLRNRSHDRTSHSQRFSRAYAYVVLSDWLRLQVGRQDFDDEREWLYDEVLDAVRVYVGRRPFEAELSVSTGRSFLEPDNSTQGIDNLVGVLRWQAGRHHRLSTYLVQRTGKGERDFRLRVFGLRSYARPERGLRHWLELARSEGHDGETPIGGYAFDAGLSYAFDTVLRPTLTAALAHATGERDPQEPSGAFRQTGLHDNSGRFGGLTSFRYYGEMLDPELSNLSVATAGLGLRPWRRLSLDLVLHLYRQDQAAKALQDTRLRATPTGESRDIGREADLIIGFRTRKHVLLELSLARFEPGSAFEEQTAAHSAKLQVRYKL